MLPSSRKSHSLIALSFNHFLPLISRIQQITLVRTNQPYTLTRLRITRHSDCFSHRWFGTFRKRFKHERKHSFVTYTCRTLTTLPYQSWCEIVNTIRQSLHILLNLICFWISSFQSSNTIFRFTHIIRNWSCHPLFYLSFPFYSYFSSLLTTQTHFPYSLLSPFLQTDRLDLTLLLPWNLSLSLCVHLCV